MRLLSRLSLGCYALWVFQPALAKAPAVTGISAVNTDQVQTITITGTNFGTMQPYTGDSPYIFFLDCLGEKTKCTSKHQAWAAGGTGDGVTLSVSSWTPTSIVISGFAGAYGTGFYILHDSDNFEIGITNPQTMMSGKKARCWGIVDGGPTTCD